MTKWEIHRLDEACLFALPLEQQRMWVGTRLKVARHLLAESQTDPATNIDPTKIQQELVFAEQDYADWEERNQHFRHTG